MAKLDKIEAAVQDLGPEELAAFRQWYDKFDGEQWDQEFEDDVKRGRLDALAQEAIRDFDAGQCKEL